MNNKKLSQDIMFKVCLWGGISISICIAILISWVESKNRNLCGRAECFETLLQMWEFPIQLFVASIALAGLRATVFRINQTSLQIAETLKQNVFKNYFDHKKDFMSLLDDLETNYNVQFDNKKNLYKVLFPMNSPVYFDVASREQESNKSPLVILVEKYNKAIDLINKNNRVLDVGEDDQKFVKLLSDLVFAIAEAKILFSIDKDKKEYYRVSEQHFASKYFSGNDCDANYFPINLYGAINGISSVFEILLNYCIPGFDQELQVSTLNIAKEKLNKKLEYVSGDFKVESDNVQ